VIGMGLFTIGVPPSAEEMARAFIFLLVVIVYAGVWLAIAMLFSIIFRSAATAALATLGLWLFLTFIWPMLAGMIGDRLFANSDQEQSFWPSNTCSDSRQARCLARRYCRSSIRQRARSAGLLESVAGGHFGAPLSLSDSVLIALPQWSVCLPA